MEIDSGSAPLPDLPQAVGSPQIGGRPLFFIVGTNAPSHCSPVTPEYKRNGGNVMKTLVSMVVLALALAFTGPAFAGDVTKATNAADCEKAGGMWDASSNKCSEKKKDY